MTIEDTYTQQKRHQFACYRAGVLNQIGQEIAELIDSTVVVRPVSRTWHADNNIETCAHPTLLSADHYATVALPDTQQSK